MRENQDKILAIREKHVGRLIFNNPERHNAMSLEMWKQTRRVMEEFNEDPEIRVIVLSGAGNKAFVSGADISKFESERSTVEETVLYNKVTTETSSSLHLSAKPTIAMIQGFCMGGGLALAINCDLRYCTPGSVFGLPAAKLGVGYSFEGIHRLTELIGPAYAGEICFTGGRFSADQALGMGLVNSVIADEELEEFVSSTATVIAENAPLTITAMKQIFLQLSKDPGSRDLEHCQGFIDRCFTSKDYVEGRRAFLAKRKPDFQGH